MSMNNTVPLEQKISVTVDAAAAASGLSRSTIYELIGDGSLESRRVAGRRLILVRSLRRLIEGDAAEQAPEATRETRG
jgi:excisionase family DNA binding protein